ncbi:snapalysin family zinc-dependent metalloprotease [Streptomyces sp. 549]|uniref:snapalysin family zinc-dependent metalloprotease n=1 Tax=Streptomyces sp. 549 TaxID=3049076 RepID=UPI0024C3B6F2|nr:snapalysin family zinc-dependent metalloprotease [Streptomyces sp. 549]MDK1473495.1 snapalysin family zinc-dependent metalloprotease [Streptomyces sp. 549]
MYVRLLLRCFAVVLATAFALVGGQAVAAPSATADRAPAARIVTYDASASAEFRAAVDRGAAIWNESVASVVLRPVAAGQRANIRVVADNGWPRAQTTSLGNGTVWMGRQAVNEGYDTIRIAAHEFGHILGLPDVKPGPCSSLMSGSSAGVTCRNPYPNAAERARVERNFGGSVLAGSPTARSASAAHPAAALS